MQVLKIANSLLFSDVHNFLKFPCDNSYHQPTSYDLK